MKKVERPCRQVLYLRVCRVMSKSCISVFVDQKPILFFIELKLLCAGVLCHTRVPCPTHWCTCPLVYLIDSLTFLIYLDLGCVFSY